MGRLKKIVEETTTTEEVVAIEETSPEETATEEVLPNEEIDTYIIPEGYEPTDPAILEKAIEEVESPVAEETTIQPEATVEAKTEAVISNDGCLHGDRHPTHEREKMRETGMIV
jgi:hypothetical protein